MAIQWKFLIFALIVGILAANGDDAKKCKVCEDSSSTELKCAKEPESVTEECTPTTGKCFSAVGNNGRVKRGCVDDTNKCDGDDCTACDATTAACNIKPITFFCKKCDSSTDPNCAQWSNADAIKNALCTEGVNKCVMTIKENKHIERRCATSNDEKCTDPKLCDVCGTSGCNAEVFPSTRRRCYQCSSGTECANPFNNPTMVKSLPCTLYVEAEECLMYGTSDTEMARGCSSDTAVKTACDAAKEKCKACKTDNCNVNAFKYSQTLQCIQCSSESTDCVWGHEKSEAKNCAKQIEFYQTEGCYTNKVADGKAERGCLHDKDNFNCDTVSTCTSCNSSNGCNNADNMDFTCYTCRSDTNPACAKPLDKESFGAEKCRNPVNANTKGCYVEKWNDIYIRSCLVDADVTTRKMCMDDSYKLCDNCPEKNCNSGKLKNSAATAAAGGFVVAASLLVLRFL